MMNTLFVIPNALMAAFAGLILFSPNAHAKVIASDSFDYATGTLVNTDNGGTGFSAGWVPGSTAYGGGYTIVVGSLSVPSNYSLGTSDGKYLALTAGTITTTTTRNLASSIDTNAPATYYFSALVSLTSGLATGDSQIRFVDAAGYDVAGFGASSASGKLRFNSAYGGIATVTGTTSNAFTVGTQYLLVGKMTFNAAGTNDVFSFSLIPSSGAIPLTEPTTWGLTANGDLSNIITGIQIYTSANTGTWNVDNFYLGDTYSSVVAESSWRLARLVNVSSLGDSLSAMGNTDTLGTGTVGYPHSRTRLTRGYLSWVELNLGWNYRSIHNYALGGSTLQQQLDFISNPNDITAATQAWGPMNTLSPPPDLVFAEGGGANLGGNTVAQIETAKQATIDALQALSPDTHVLSLAIWPLGNSAVIYDGDRKTVNAWMASSYSSGQVRNLDSDSLLEDPANPDHILPAYTSDGVHTTAIGAKAEGDFVVSQLAGLNLLPAPIIYPETLDAADDPSNLLRDFGSDNSQLQKLGGTITNLANFAPGSVSPSGWMATANAEWQTSAGSLPTMSTLAEGNNLNAVSVTIPNGIAPSTTANTVIGLGTTGTGISAARASGKGVVGGSSFRAGVRIDGIQIQNLIYIYLLIRYQIDGVKYSVTSGFPYASGSADVLPSDFSADVLSPEFSFPPSTSTAVISGMTVYLGFVPGTPVGGTVRISRPYIRPYTYIPSWP
ncbi:SGNH/GDSL hydrolase family protein [Edaphobacter flagellatus]|uniref:SGNH/GDSL hydrolase family protein n=1 Tax=Edaphobacter flagellatus TaxID=1933044 RepID=UPI0021B3FDBB|nr:SGNH/GDSL hydrolase family protein [Edaphobacter flagellatus]